MKWGEAKNEGDGDEYAAVHHQNGHLQNTAVIDTAGILEHSLSSEYSDNFNVDQHYYYYYKKNNIYYTYSEDSSYKEIKHQRISVVTSSKEGTQRLEDSEDEDVPTAPVPFYKVPLFWTALVFFTVVGGTNVLVAKYGVTITSFPCAPWETCEPELFNGYMGIAFLKFFYQAIFSVLVYKVLDYKILKTPFFSKREDYLTSKTYGKGVYARFFITSALETVFTITDRAATVYVRSSVVTAVAASQIFFSTVGDLFINRRAFMIKELIGFVILCGGLTLYIYQIMTADSGSEGQDLNATLGISLACAGSAGRGLHASYQGRIMNKYRFPALKALFLDSCIGMVYVLCVTAILNAAGFLDSYAEFWMIFRSWEVTLSVQGFGLLSIFFNGGSALLGKFVSGVYRIVLLRLPAFVTWLLELCIGWSIFDYLILIAYIIIFLSVIVFAGALPKAINFKWLSRPWLCGWLYPSASATLSKNQVIKYGNDIKRSPF